MSRRPKGPRLYLRHGRIDRRSGKPLPDIWYIRDGQTEISTGCGPDQLHGPDGAEAQLAAYIAAKWAPRAAQAPEGDTPDRRSDPSRVLIAEVVAYYLTGRWGASVAPPAEGEPEDPVSEAAANAASRLKTVLGWWGDKTLSDVRRSSCQAYVQHRCGQTIKAFAQNAPNARRVTEAGARRELEDLSAAIGYWHDEHHLTHRPKVVLPEKAESPRDALTRAQAARLLMAARGYRLTGETHASGRPTWARLRDSGPANRAHLKRFILIGLYTGPRPGVIPKLLWQESPTQAWVDLDAAVVYRRGKRERDHRTKRRPLAKIPPRLLAHMRRWRTKDQALMADRAEADLPTTNALIHHGGKPLAGRIRRSFAAAVRDAGLPDGVTPHWLRHTAATWLMEGGADPWEAAGYLGMTTKTLEDNYGHHRPDHQAGALRAMAKGRA